MATETKTKTTGLKINDIPFIFRDEKAQIIHNSTAIEEAQSTVIKNVYWQLEKANAKINNLTNLLKKEPKQTSASKGAEIKLSTPLNMVDNKENYIIYHKDNIRDIIHLMCHSTIENEPKEKIQAIFNLIPADVRQGMFDIPEVYLFPEFKEALKASLENNNKEIKDELAQQQQGIIKDLKKIIDELDDLSSQQLLVFNQIIDKFLPSVVQGIKYYREETLILVIRLLGKLEYYDTLNEIDNILSNVNNVHLETSLSNEDELEKIRDLIHEYMSECIEQSEDEQKGVLVSSEENKDEKNLEDNISVDYDDLCNFLIASIDITVDVDDVKIIKYLDKLPISYQHKFIINSVDYISDGFDGESDWDQYLNSRPIDFWTDLLNDNFIDNHEGILGLALTHCRNDDEILKLIKICWEEDYEEPLEFFLQRKNLSNDLYKNILNYFDEMDPDQDYWESIREELKIKINKPIKKRGKKTTK